MHTTEQLNERSALLQRRRDDKSRLLAESPPGSQAFSLSSVIELIDHALVVGVGAEYNAVINTCVITARMTTDMKLPQLRQLRQDLNAEAEILSTWDDPEIVTSELNFATDHRVDFCKAIACPYAPIGNSVYGCQRYLNASHCHLKSDQKFVTLNLSTSGYWWVAPADTDFELWESRNGEYLRRDTAYQKDCKFQDDFPDFGKRYPNRRI